MTQGSRGKQGRTKKNGDDSVSEYFLVDHCKVDRKMFGGKKASSAFIVVSVDQNYPQRSVRNQTPVQWSQ